MWQKWWDDHKDNVSFVAIAEDNQPAELIIPWVEEAGATFMVLHDQENVLYERYKPNVTSTLVIDENGRLVRPWKWADMTEPDFVKEITSWVTSGSIPSEWLDMDANILPEETPEQKEAYARLRLATILAENGKRPEALVELKHAAHLAPNNYVIMHELGVLERPADYYEGDMPSVNR